MNRINTSSEVERQMTSRKNIFHVCSKDLLIYKNLLQVKKNVYPIQKCARPKIQHPSEILWLFKKISRSQPKSEEEN
jgi:hypothetical protein